MLIIIIAIVTVISQQTQYQVGRDPYSFTKARINQTLHQPQPQQGLQPEKLHSIQAEGERSCGFNKSDILLTNDLIKNLSCDISTTTASISEVTPAVIVETPVYPPVCPENKYWGYFSVCGPDLSYYHCCEMLAQLKYWPNTTTLNGAAHSPALNV